MKYLQKVVNFPQDPENGVVYYSTEEDMVLIKKVLPLNCLKVSANGDGCLLINNGYEGQDSTLTVHWEDGDTVYTNSDIFNIEGVNYYVYGVFESGAITYTKSGDYEDWFLFEFIELMPKVIINGSNATVMFEGEEDYILSRSVDNDVVINGITYYAYLDIEYGELVYFRTSTNGTYEDLPFYIITAMDSPMTLEIGDNNAPKEQTLCYTEGENQILTANTKIVSVEKMDTYKENATLTAINIPNGVTEIEGDAFRYCSNLTSVVIPNSVTSIGSYAFIVCRNLNTVNIGNSVTSIDYCAFSNCSSLSSVTIPNSITAIYDCAFDGCYNLTSVTYNGVTYSVEWEIETEEYDGEIYTYGRYVEGSGAALIAAMQANGVNVTEEIFREAPIE